MGKAELLLYVALFALICGPAMAVTLGITADGRFFTLDGVPTYLNGISYYSGCSVSSTSSVIADLDDMHSRGINWMRVWTFWSGQGTSVAVTDLSGNVREPYMTRLKTLITEANTRGMVVDVTMSRDRPASTIEQYIDCAETIATQLLPYRNVYIDVGNERDVGDSRYVSYPEITQLISAIKAIDPNRLCTASGVPGSQADMDNYITSGCDFVCPHLCREEGCAAQTFGTVRTLISYMTNLGHRMPVHMQEPFRRAYASYQPIQEDYYRDNSGARAADAAGWCLHNGSGGGRERSFWMGPGYSRLFEEPNGLDSVEIDAVNNIDDQIGGTDWNVRRYQAEYVEQLAHATGVKDGFSWSANTVAHAAGYLTYGPYLNGIPAGPYRAAFRMMIGDNSANNDVVALLDVSSGGVVIASRSVRRQEFTASNTWQTFGVDYIGAGQQNLEFRVYWYDNCTLKVDHITFSADPPPDTVIGLDETDGAGQITLSWTNPMTPSFTGTTIRCKTNGYPTSETDGTFVCEKANTPSSSDSFVHGGLTAPIYYYAAFAHDAAGRYSSGSFTYGTPHVPHDWISENFDAYTNGDLGGQGDWATFLFDSADVQSSFAKGGTGKATIMDCIATGASITNQILVSEKTTGYYYLLLDVAMNAEGTAAQEFANVYIYGSNSSSEISKLRIQKGRLMADHGSGTVVLTPAAANNTWYNIKFGFNIDTRKLDVWIDGVKKTSAYSWKGGATNISRITIVSDRNATLTVQQAFVDNLIFDLKPGTVTTAADDGAWTPSLSKLHFTATPVAGAGEYHYAVGTSSGGTQVRDWTSCGMSTDYTASGLSLSENTTYYVSVQAGTGHGTWGDGANTNGIKVAPGVASILAAKALPNGAAASTRALRGELVSAVFPGCFYIQEPSFPIGLKVVSASAVTVGDQVNVAGFMMGSGAERYIDCTGNGVIKAAGPGGPYPVAMANASAGGTVLNPNAPGVLGGIGPNNIGLFVTVFGKVTQRQTTDPKYFYVDDGGGLKDGTTTAGVDNVGVRVIADPAAFAEGAYVAAKGIVSCFDSTGLRRQALPSQITILQAAP